MGSLEQEIALIIEDENLCQLHPSETPQFVEEFKKLLRKINAARTALTMEFCPVDSRGRLTIPEPYRLLLNIEKGSEMEVHLHPPDRPKGLLLRKSF